MCASLLKWGMERSDWRVHVCACVHVCENNLNHCLWMRVNSVCYTLNTAVECGGNCLHEPFWGTSGSQDACAACAMLCVCFWSSQLWGLVHRFFLEALLALFVCMCLHACVFSLICAFFSLHLLVCGCFFFLSQHLLQVLPNDNKVLSVITSFLSCFFLPFW